MIGAEGAGAGAAARAGGAPADGAGLLALEPPLRAGLQARTPLLWRNPRRAVPAPGTPGAAGALSLQDMLEADALLRRWAPALQRLFPELASSGGLIESELLDFPAAAAVTGVAPVRPAYIKADHALPVAGSIKARGGIFEVLAHAEQLALRSGLLADRRDTLRLLEAPARALYARHTVAVGSTGNLGLSIGIIAAALGFRAVVHMSRDAKAWKKALLAARGVTVIEHAGDYAAAVAAGRRATLAAADAHFVDDENSRSLFLGYAVAALRLRDQLQARAVRVDAAQPLFVHLPCGVGGAPGGIAFGLAQLFGAAVQCYFAEPCAAPAMLLRLASGGAPVSVYELGLDNRTEADGLAVALGSALACTAIGHVVAGAYTVRDADLLRIVALLQQHAGLRIEPSAAAGFLGPLMLRGDADAARATHVFWTTGGALVPDAEYAEFLRRGRALLAAG